MKQGYYCKKNIRVPIIKRQNKQKRSWKRTAKSKKFVNTAVKNSAPKLQATLAVITAGTNKHRSEMQGQGLIETRKQISTLC